MRNVCEILAIVSAFAGIAMAECIPVLIGCFGLSILFGWLSMRIEK